MREDATRGREARDPYAAGIIGALPFFAMRPTLVFRPAAVARVARALCTIVLAPALGHAQAARVQAPIVGTFFADRIDALPLPLTDRVTDTDGTTYLVEIDRLVLSLRPGNRFRASVRFRRTINSRDLRGRDRAVPLQSMMVNGSYAIAAGEIRFTPDSSSDAGGLRMLTGRVDGPRRITMPFDYRNGTTERRRTLTLVLQDNVY